MSCPFCGMDPYEYVDVGLGSPGVPVAVNCCQFGQMLFDDQSPDKRWSKLAERILDELGETKYDEERMARADEIFQKLVPSEDQ